MYVYQTRVDLFTELPDYVDQDILKLLFQDEM